jgi:hypothetical protein
MKQQIWPLWGQKLWNVNVNNVRPKAEHLDVEVWPIQTSVLPRPKTPINFAMGLMIAKGFALRDPELARH